MERQEVPSAGSLWQWLHADRGGGRGRVRGAAASSHDPVAVSLWTSAHVRWWWSSPVVVGFHRRWRAGNRSLCPGVKRFTQQNPRQVVLERNGTLQQRLPACCLPNSATFGYIIARPSSPSFHALNGKQTVICHECQSLRLRCNPLWQRHEEG